MAKVSGNDMAGKLVPKKIEGSDKALSPLGTISKMLEGMRPQLLRALPEGGVTPERLIRLVLTQFSKIPELFECTPQSIMGAMMQAAQEGLEIGVDGQCWMLPFKKGNIKEANYVRGYKGVIKLAYQSDRLLSIQAREVREGDFFEYEFGLTEKLRHVPAPEQVGKILCYYAYALLKGGGRVFDVKSDSWMTAHKNKYVKSKDSPYSPWNTAPIEQGKKTMILQIESLLPKSVKDKFANSSMFDADTLIESDSPDLYQAMGKTEVFQVPEEKPIDGNAEVMITDTTKAELWKLIEETGRKDYNHPDELNDLTEKEAGICLQELKRQKEPTKTLFDSKV